MDAATKAHVAQALRAAAGALLKGAAKDIDNLVKRDGTLKLAASGSALAASIRGPLYHGTKGPLAGRIAREGLKSDSGFSRFGPGQHGVSTTTDPRIARDFGSAIFVLDPAELRRAGYDLAVLQHPTAPNEAEVRVSKGSQTVIPPHFFKELRLVGARPFELRWWAEQGVGFPVVSGSASGLLSASLRIEEYASPLDYHRAGNVRRYALVDPGVGDPDKHDAYFAEIWKTRRYTKSGKPLKKPKTELVSKGAEPGVVAFLDWTPWGDGIYIHYMKTRQDQKGKRHAQRLLDHLYKKHKTAAVIHWGKVMNEVAWSLYERYKDLEEHGYPHTIGTRYF